jgi:hypothetical protein
VTCFGDIVASSRLRASDVEPVKVGTYNFWRHPFKGRRIKYLALLAVLAATFSGCERYDITGEKYNQIFTIRDHKTGKVYQATHGELYHASWMISSEGKIYWFPSKSQWRDWLSSGNPRPVDPRLIPNPHT